MDEENKVIDTMIFKYDGSGRVEKNGKVYMRHFFLTDNEKAGLLIDVQVEEPKRKKWKIKKPQHLSIGISIVAIWIGLFIHINQDNQAHQKIREQYQEIIQTCQELGSMLDERIDTDKHQSELLQELFDLLQKN
ncbi:MAG: hypothetical protein J6C37_00175 [Roseburia sp.]|nr:hypothetical protein [Roseburia sp.]